MHTPRFLYRVAGPLVRDGARYGTRPPCCRMEDAGVLAYRITDVFLARNGRPPFPAVEDFLTPPPFV